MSIIIQLEAPKTTFYTNLFVVNPSSNMHGVNFFEKCEVFIAFWLCICSAETLVHSKVYFKNSSFYNIWVLRI